jgi:hypothetical protein
VEEGAKVLLQVKYGLIRLINVEADLCDQIENVDLHCPLKEGEITFQKKVDIPREIPPVCSPLCIILTIAKLMVGTLFRANTPQPPMLTLRITKKLPVFKLKGLNSETSCRLVGLEKARLRFGSIHALSSLCP